MQHETRVCSHCGKPMTAGYCIEGGMEYYCGDACLHEHYTDEEYVEMHDGGDGDSYWTEWDGEGGAVNSATFEPHREPGNQA